MTSGQLTLRAEALAAGSPRTLLGIVGPPGAGKSTLSADLLRRMPGQAVVVPMDGFHLANEVLVDLGRRDRKGAPDTFDVGGYVALLKRLRAHDEALVYAPRFDRQIETSIGSALAVPASVPLVVTEGNYLLYDEDGWEAVRAVLDEVWYLDLPEGERTRRLVRRREAAGESRAEATEWVRSVDEKNAAAVSRGRSSADLVIHLIPETPTSHL